MTIGAGILLIAVGAILRFGIATVSTHGFGIHTIGDILMFVGALGVILWLLVFAPWAPRARSRRALYRDDVPPPPVEEVTRTRRYPADDPYYQDDYRR